MIPAIYPSWEGFVSIPISDFRENFDFILVKSADNKNPLIDVLGDVICESKKTK